MERLKFGQSFSQVETNGMPFMDSKTLGELTGYPQDPHIVLQLLLKDHPLSRFTMRHEFSHLSRLDPGDVSALIGTQHVRSILERRLGLYREELTAFGDEWKFINALYSKKDLPRLRELYPKLSPETLKFINDNNLVTFDAATNIYHFGELQGDPKKIQAVKEFLEGHYNDIFLEVVEKATSGTKSAFIKDKVRQPGYKMQQSLSVFTKKVNRLKRITKRGAAVGAATGTVLFSDWLINKVKKRLEEPRQN
jgi:hypothetical protein